MQFSPTSYYFLLLISTILLSMPFIIKFGKLLEYLMIFHFVLALTMKCKWYWNLSVPGAIIFCSFFKQKFKFVHQNCNTRYCFHVCNCVPFLLYQVCIIIVLDVLLTRFQFFVPISSCCYLSGTFFLEILPPPPPQIIMLVCTLLLWWFILF
jgi:hypothetical protein